MDFDGAIAFRLDYESTFRPRQDRGAAAGPEPVVRTARRGLETLPHSLLQTGRRLSFPARRPIQDRAAPLSSAARMKLHMPASENPPRAGTGAADRFVSRLTFRLRSCNGDAADRWRATP